MERHPQRSPRRPRSSARTLERVLQAVRHARAGQLESLEAHLSDLIGRAVTLHVEAPAKPEEAPLPPAVVLALPSRVLPSKVDASFLQPRMASVLALIVAGQTDKEIAETLGVSYATARTYVRRLCQSLHVSGRRGVCLWAQQRTKPSGLEPA
jgi:DNA-binding NarL/FixJ family response regulator